MDAFKRRFVRLFAPFNANASRLMSRLFTYCIPFDDGAAPNPFWGVCTLAICKPFIRKAAYVGDWIVGTGSKSVKGRDLSNCVVYAMEVSSVMTLQEYDVWAREFRPEKIPDIANKDLRRRVGDCIYDYSSNPPHQRAGVHTESNRKTDLGGENVLLSLNFFYFGDKPVRLPSNLQQIVHQTQGHKVNANAQYVALFLQWLQNQALSRNSVLSSPDLINEVASNLSAGATLRCDGDKADANSPIC